MKPQKTATKVDYIYIRIGQDAKNKLKELSRKDGSNMTILARQVLMRFISEHN